jgi:hypothetical protein
MGWRVRNQAQFDILIRGRLWPTGDLMKLTAPAVLAALLNLAAMDVAKADWVDNAWSKNSAAKNGNPSITIGRAGRVSILLPRSVLREAQAAGATTQAALLAFLAKYGPQMCSELLDLNLPQKNLKVELRILDPAVEISGLFVASPDHQEFLLDYVPSSKVRCMSPAEKVS